ncbi:hypothetical protein BDY19DRAFT_908496 [Irpex rosettiformis]|uniref:Uncharacterized protein n=1 Tax=Irpex rosettiformis TaxID=378272 RepID=A0ACB8TVZ3_9APHY|nr:hypothetical protein BDY19DRAFT_908496 [Irpex rosettiformis]
MNICESVRHPVLAEHAEYVIPITFGVREYLLLEGLDRGFGLLSSPACINIKRRKLPLLVATADIEIYDSVVQGSESADADKCDRSASQTQKIRECDVEPSGEDVQTVHVPGAASNSPAAVVWGIEYLSDGNDVEVGLYLSRLGYWDIGSNLEGPPDAVVLVVNDNCELSFLEVRPRVSGLLPYDESGSSRVNAQYQCTQLRDLVSAIDTTRMVVDTIDTREVSRRMAFGPGLSVLMTAILFLKATLKLLSVYHGFESSNLDVS